MSRRIRVLVADDERNLRELMVRELGRKGHEVDDVGDGEAALARLQEASYDVVVLDMKMPKREGIEVLRELQVLAEPPQVIVMTGFQEVSTAVEAMKLGAYDYLTKTSSSARPRKRGSSSATTRRCAPTRRAGSPPPAS